MRLKLLSAGVAAGIFMVGSAAQGAALVQYDFQIANGASNTELLAGYQTPTTSAANVSTNNFTFGSTTTPSTNSGAGNAGFYTSPGPNYLSVSNTSATDDTQFYIDIKLTPTAGFSITPTSFTIVGGRGGGSNARSVLLFDNVDGLPGSILPNTASTPPATNPPTVSGGSQVGSTQAFTALRNSANAMDSFTFNFPGTDAALTSQFDVRVFFDTQASGQAKNIDISSLTLNGTVAAVPEPASLAGAVIVGVGALVRRRNRA